MMFLHYFFVTTSSVFCFQFFFWKCSPKYGCVLYTGAHCTQVNTVCASRCLETVSNAVSFTLLTPYWFWYWRLDFDLRLVKNMMHSLPKLVWQEWPVQKLSRLKTWHHFCRAFLAHPLVSFREMLLAGCNIPKNKVNNLFLLVLVL